MSCHVGMESQKLYRTSTDEVIVTETEENMPCIQGADASLLWGHGADTGNTTRDTLL